jgi:hypothetical protein
VLAWQQVQQLLPSWRLLHTAPAHCSCTLHTAHCTLHTAHCCPGAPLPGWPPDLCPAAAPPAGLDYEDGDDINQLLEGITNANLPPFW